MISFLQPVKQKLLPLIVILLLSVYQLVRIIAFMNVYGGIEHDGGWMLSISRSLAEQGTYTTMVSTLTDPAIPAGINVDQKFDIQAPDGRIWFFTGNGIGPASIVPDALILKLFGTGFWALHLGPLLFYTGFLLLAAVVVYRLAGLGAVVLFHAFLFFYPHLSIFLGYEAMGEMPGMMYLLWAYLAFTAAVSAPLPRPWPFLAAGLVMGLGLNAKLITLWSLSGILIWAGLWWGWRGLDGRREKGADRPQNKIGQVIRFKELLLLAGGVAIPVVLWELVHLVVLTQLTSFELYLRHADQRLKFIMDDGSGLGLRIHTGPEFFWDKFFLLAEAAHPQRWVTAIIFLIILLGGLAWLWRWREQPHKQHLLGPIWLGWLANTLWFVGLAKTGWPRHFWFGLVLAVILLSSVAVATISAGIESYRSFGHKEVRAWPAVLMRFFMPAAGLMILALVGWGFVSQPHVWGFFLPDEIVPYWQERQINNKYGASLPWIITPKAAQIETVAYLKQLPSEANIYYPAQHKAAEISAQVGRVLYPLSRRAWMQPHPQDVALVSPTLIAPWLEPVRREALLNLVREDCPKPLLSNDYYMICPLPPVVP